MVTRGTVLVVEDDPTIAALLREMLVDEGYRALTAPTVAGALEILAAIRVGLIVTDAYLPAAGIPGDPWEPLAPLVAAAHGAPLILCSAHVPAAYADFAARGFAAALPRPFDLDALLALVASLMPGAETSPPAVEPDPAKLCARREGGRHHR